MSKKATSAGVKALTVIIILSIGVVVALLIASPPFVMRLRANIYANRIDSPKGNRGSASMQLIALGPEYAVPQACRLLLSDDYMTRRHGLIIIEGFKDAESTEALLENIAVEDNPQNIAWGLRALVNIHNTKPELIHRLEFLFDHPAGEVKAAFPNAMLVLTGTSYYNRDIGWWKQWWEENAHKYPADGTDAKTSATP